MIIFISYIYYVISTVIIPFRIYSYESISRLWVTCQLLESSKRWRFYILSCKSYKALGMNIFLCTQNMQSFKYISFGFSWCKPLLAQITVSKPGYILERQGMHAVWIKMAYFSKFRATGRWNPSKQLVNLRFLFFKNAKKNQKGYCVRILYALTGLFQKKVVSVLKQDWV